MGGSAQTQCFKYFEFLNAQKISVTVTGKPKGLFTVTDGKTVVANITVNGAGTFSSKLKISDGVHPLFFTYKGKGKCNFHSINIE